MWMVLLLGLALAFYLLYIYGYLPVKSAAALVFLGSLLGRDRCGASFSFCTGTVRRVIRFREDGLHRFCLDAQLEKGELEAMLLSRAGQPLLILNDRLPTGEVYGEKGKRYTLVVTFRSASGSFELTWE